MMVRGQSHGGPAQWRGVMDLVDVGPLSRSTLTQTKTSFKSFASGGLQTTPSMTWHQWQVDVLLERISAYLPPAPGKCLIAPGVPVDGAVSVLEQVDFFTISRLEGESPGTTTSGRVRVLDHIPDADA